MTATDKVMPPLVCEQEPGLSELKERSRSTVARWRGPSRNEAGQVYLLVEDCHVFPPFCRKCIWGNVFLTCLSFLSSRNREKVPAFNFFDRRQCRPYDIDSRYVVPDVAGFDESSQGSSLGPPRSFNDDGFSSEVNGALVCT